MKLYLGEQRRLNWCISRAAVILFFILETPLALAGEDYEQWQAWADNYPSWVEPIEPFKVIGNVYYVGTQGLGSFLITSGQGHTLIDGGLPQTADLILSNVRTLGFDVTDIRYLLNSHAHFDHSGGLAKIKRVTSAKLIASKQDTPWLESGNYPGSDNKYYAAPPVEVDQIVGHAERVTLGSNVFTANITPGHSPGCTSWQLNVTDRKQQYNTLFFCSATVAGNRLVGPPQYSGIVADYRKTFAMTRSWRPDVFLANHPEFFRMETKLLKLRSGDASAFIDREGFPAMIERLEAAFNKALVRQQSALQSAASTRGKELEEQAHDHDQQLSDDSDE